MIKAGDILKFRKPIYEWHKKDLQNGAYYVIWQPNKSKIWQTDDGVWHVKDTDEFEPMRVGLQFKNGFMDCGELSQFKDYKLVGMEGEFENGKQSSNFYK